MILEEYIQEILGKRIYIKPVQRQSLTKLPLYIRETYKFYTASLFEYEFLLAELKNKNLSIFQTEKNFTFIKKLLNKRVVLLMNEIASFNRKRLIEKKINFIVPGKQLFMPELLLDLRESFPLTKQENEKLLPSAQLLILYHILHPNSKWNYGRHTFKEWADKFGYTAMSITNAIENLKYHNLIDVFTEKGKFIMFGFERSEMLNFIIERNLWINPVLKRVYVDEKPKGVTMLLCHTSALPEYTDMNPGNQEFYAIDKNIYYKLKKNSGLVNANENEGKYCLEVWKYDPLKLTEELMNKKPVVDRLSLYFSLKDSADERIQMALEQLLKEFRW